MLVLTIIGALAGPAAPCTFGQNAYYIVVSNRISEVQPSATIELWAGFDADLYAFAGSALDFHASPDSGGFSDPHRILDSPGTKDGDVAPDGDAVTGIISGQIHCPIECWPDRDNPILVWRVTWSTADFTLRTVELFTETAKFDVYLDQQGNSRSYLDELVEGSAQIGIGCYADCDESGALDLFDYLCFIGQFNMGAKGGDCDGSGGLDLFDFLCFVNAFNAGC